MSTTQRKNGSEIGELHPKSASFAERVIRWSSENYVDFPWRRNLNPYAILVAEMLLKRTTSTAVSRVYDQFLAKFASLEVVNAASEDELAFHLSGLGLQRQRARSFKATVSWILEKHQGEIPSDINGLIAVPGLGRYSGAAIACFGFGKRVPIVDGNVERILVRVFNASMAKRPTASAFEETARRVLPDVNHKTYNYGLLDLGRMICRPIRPRCSKCPLSEICDFHSNLKDSSVSDGSTRVEPVVSTKLRSIRIKRGFTIVRLASDAGVSKTTVLNIEMNRTSPRQTTVTKLANALCVSKSDLL